MALADVLNQIKEWPLKRKIGLASAILLSIGLIWGVVLWSDSVDYQVLYSNLSSEDAGQVVAKLKEMKVPYKVTGNVVYVPSNKVHELRLELSAQGIPQGGGVGFEIFDKVNLGVTDFVQKLNYRRALQGELARTIKQLSEVEQCRVHIAIPEKTIFTDKEERPSASVVLKLKAGRTLSNAQIGGIVHLVASSVEGMKPTDVTVVDSMGNLLTKENSSQDALLDAKQLEYQRLVDRSYEQRLQSMLEGINGKGKAIVRVSTKIDFTQVDRTEEKFDPDSIALRSEQRTQEKTTGSTQGGIPGVVSNQPGGNQPATTGTGPSSQKQSESLNYEVSRTVSKFHQPRGEIKSISVAVLVDGTYKKEKDKTVYVPRTEAELKKYEDIVKAAIGFNKDRGDVVTVSNMQFEAASDDIAPVPIDYVKVISTVLKYLVPIVVTLILALFVFKPLMQLLKPPPPPAPVITQATGLAEQEILAKTKSPEKTLQDEVLELVSADPKKAAAVLKEWMAEA